MDHAGRRRRTLALAGLAALLLAAAALGYFLLGRGDSKPVEDALRDGGCTYREHEALPAGNHITNVDAKPKQWNSDPPTSGPHHFQPVVWGIYDAPVSQAQAVHNLEHGGIVIQWGRDVPSSAVEEIGRFYRDDPEAMLAAPLPRLGNKIALTAWHIPAEDPARAATAKGKGVLATCTTFDGDAFEAFRDAYRFKGPERFPPDDPALQPGA